MSNRICPADMWQNYGYAIKLIKNSTFHHPHLIMEVCFSRNQCAPWRQRALLSLVNNKNDRLTTAPYIPPGSIIVVFSVMIKYALPNIYHVNLWRIFTWLMYPVFIYIFGYIFGYPTHVVDVRKGIRSKNVAPILFINTPGKGVLWRGSSTLSENGL